MFAVLLKRRQQPQLRRDAHADLPACTLRELREIRVLDREGGGDGSVGGMLYGILQGWPAEKCMQFGWATGALAATMMTDYGAPADEEQVWSIWKGNARIKR